MKNRLLLLLCCFCSFSWTQAKDFLLKSPNNKIVLQVNLDDAIRYRVSCQGVSVLEPSALSLTLADGTVLGAHPRLQHARRSSVNTLVPAVAYRKKEVNNRYNELVLTFKGGYIVQFRAYDEGVAYRFNLHLKSNEVVIKDEQCEYNWKEDHPVYYAPVYRNGTIEQQFSNSFENRYSHAPLTQIKKDKLLFLPLLVELPENMKACITEVNQFAYPGMYLQNFESKTGLKSLFAPYPKEMKQGGHNNLQLLVQSREAFIAKVAGQRALPWRAMALSMTDKEMADNDLVFCLADETRLTDTSWIKPGKVAWDWWNDWNISGVDFKSGVNNETYRYYIDFASKYGIEYVILDEGWAVNLKADMMQVVPEIDLKGLIDYAASKHVGIILWGGYQAMDKDMDLVCKHYAAMGVKGFKVDFMDRDDQLAVEFYNRMAETAAKYKLMIDFHGAFKPSGLNRTYPNVINYEGVYGLEQMKWEPEGDQVTYDVTLPFIRQVAGPIDYTQGAMRNATKQNYYPCYNEPMSQGTRCHQLAEYIVFESPLNMLCDSPSAYQKEPDYTRFLTSIPTVWDETKQLDGRVANYVVTARRKGTDWYIGGLNNWDAREITVDLSFISDYQNYRIELFRDGINAHRIASDYAYCPEVSSANGILKVLMQPGGGFLLKLTKK
ncbi:MAG: glycoside hydrolase family 97 protein [Bacteroidia bacterium]|nr:glycoside hydrolase family 97 protein [Bacteroidia bacterium]